MSNLDFAPSFNRSEVEVHVSLLHDLAEGVDGILILAAFEEGGPPSVQRFRIGDVTGMVEAIMGFDGHPRANLYTPWAVMRPDLEAGRKGAEADVVAVLAAIPDLDGDKGVKTELPIEAPYIVESSPGNFQPVYVFERPLPPLEAKPVLTAICDFVGGDSATKDSSHVWRIAGTVNVPTKSKLARGRSPVPAAVTIRKPYDGRFISPAALLALAPAPRRPNGHDTAASGPLSFAEEARLRGALKFIPADDRNKQWRPVCMALHTVGARALCDEWSKTSDKFDADEQEKAGKKQLRWELRLRLRFLPQSRVPSWITVLLFVLAAFLMAWGMQPKLTEAFVGRLPWGNYLLKALAKLDLMLSGRN